MIYAQIILTIFIFFALSRVFLRFQESKLTRNSFLSWTILWLIVVLVIWRPSITTDVARILGIGRGADLLIYLSIIALFYLIFRIYVKLEELERQITYIIRLIALLKPSKRKRNRK